MNVLKKLNTAFRSGFREIAETVVDANAIRIFDQEINDCEAATHQAKQDLSRVIAQKLKLQREARSIEEWIENKERQATEAIRQGEVVLARDIAEVIAEKELIVTDYRDKCGQLEGYELSVKRSLRLMVTKVKEYKRELQLFQATVSAQKASEALSGSQLSITAGVSEMEASVSRIRSIQNEVSINIEAVEQLDVYLSERDLDKRIVESGVCKIKDAADVVYDRLLEKAEQKE